MTIAQTILEQLGGNRFSAITGAKNFLNLGNGLLFSLPRFSNLKINQVKITINSKDLYDISFLYLRGTNCKEVKIVNDVYCDELEDVFTRETGLVTRLF